MPRDLAGLAALGALGMMLANKKKQSNVDTSGVSDMDLTGGARSMTPDTGELRDETGALSNLRRNTETGDLYSPNEPITSPSATSVAKVQKAVRTPPPDVGSKGSLGTMTRLSPDAGKVGKRFHPEYPEEAEKAVAAEAKAKTPKSTYRSPFTGKVIEEDATPTRSPFTGKTYKKGGVIKMAKGGVTRSSASSRADGIASKGHTRGRLL